MLWPGGKIEEKSSFFQSHLYFSAAASLHLSSCPTALPSPTHTQTSGRLQEGHAPTPHPECKETPGEGQVECCCNVCAPLHPQEDRTLKMRRRVQRTNAATQRMGRQMGWNPQRDRDSSSRKVNGERITAPTKKKNRGLSSVKTIHAPSSDHWKEAGFRQLPAPTTSYNLYLSIQSQSI